jgi:amino acid adenylation domain-containing protein
MSQDLAIAAAQNIKERDYWLEKLAGRLTRDYFPYDHNKPGEPVKCTAGPVTTSITGDLFDRLTAVGQGFDYTLHMILSATAALVLNKYTYDGSADVVIGVPIYKQERDGDKAFVNTVLALRIDLDGNMTVKELLLQVRQSMLEADENKNFPIQSLAPLLNIPVQGDDFPLFDVAVLLENIHSLEYLEPAAVNMIFNAGRTGRALELELFYNGSRYERGTVERIALHFTRLLRQLIFDPDRELCDVDMTTAEERRQILEEFNDTAAPYPHDRTIHRLFEEQAGQRGDWAAAVCTGDERGTGSHTLTYGELNERAGRLAAGLKQNGVQPGDIVGIMAERSLEMAIAVLGILKAGGAYLPVEPGYPSRRIDYMMTDSSARLLLTLEKIGELIDCPAEKIPDSPGPAREKNSLAYVIYTSGTTGKPKGVMVEHHSVVRLVRNTGYIDFNEPHRILQTGALAFDASTFEIWGALLNGGVLFLSGGREIIVPHVLKNAVRGFDVSTLWLTCALFNQMVDADIEIFAGLRHLLVGGEVLSPAHINRLRRRFPGPRVLNCYGPTENTTFSTTYLIDREHGERIPIGRPIANSTAYILDRRRRMTPVGVTGELWVGGDGVARGYLNSPELTAEKFSNGLYKTGDLARWLPGGNIDFIGRIDHQVKIHGFRIELEEIESCLLSIKNTRDCVVTVREDNAGQKYLAAYVTGDDIDAAGIGKILAHRLPHYMIPRVTILERLPLTHTGKVDRDRLPEPGVAGEQDYAPPRDSLEESLAQTWSQVLGGRRVGREDNFFQLGGNSLKAAAVISEIHRTLDVKVPLAQLFLSPTIGQLARYARGLEQEAHAAVQPAEERDYYPASSAQKRLFVLQRLNAGYTGYNIPAFLELHGALDAGKLELCFQRLIARHESLRTSFHMIGRQPVQIIHEHVDFAIEYYGAGEIIDEVTGAFVRPFDLSSAPLLRVGVIKKDANFHILMVDMHHVISDGTSLGTAIRDFMAFYNDGEPGPPPVQYKEYSLWRERLLLSGEIKQQETFWLQQFEGNLPVLELPADYPRPPVMTHQGASGFIVIDSQHTAALKKLALEEGATLFMVLLALLNILLARLGGQEDIVIGTPAAGREHSDFQAVIGMFVNTLPLRNFPSAGKTAPAFLREVKERTLRAFANQDYQFEALVERLNIDRDTSHNPLFDVMFSMQNTDIPSLEIPGLRLTPFPVKTTAATFDMVFTISEAGDVLYCENTYRTSLFRGDTIDALLGYFNNIISSVSENPHQRIDRVDLIGKEEKRRLLVDFNDTGTPYPREKTLGLLFEEQAERTPDAVAVTGPVGWATYKEINRRAGQVAYVLKQRGVAADDIAAIMMPPSLEMVAGLLGILKAGAAYLPIDPGYPKERIDYMLADSGAKMVLTIDDDIFNFSVPALDCCPSLRSSSLAYVIYTSGTTGRPRGAAIQHYSAVNTLLCREHEYRMSTDDVSPQLFSHAFDGFVTSFFTPLLSGSRVVLVSGETLKDVRALKEILVKEHVSHFICVPPLFRALMEILDSEEAKTLKVVTLAGDRLTSDLAALARQKNAGLEIANEYGVTEAAVMSTIFRRQERDDVVKIGRPTWNTRVYILSKTQQLQPTGVPGEMFIAGDGLARGYLNNPELTAGRFVFIFNGSYRSYRSYKTGDLARWLGDGNIEFLGRNDFQVKIRGFRIEPGEIEKRLIDHPGVNEAAVTVRENKSGDKLLCAYVTAAGTAGETALPGELKGYLAQVLPGYMIPSYFTVLPRLPLTPNGKIDREALPGPEIKSSAGYIKPATHREKLAVAAWEELLGVERVGIDDNFFDLGGNSLNIVQLAARLQEAFEQDIDTLTLFRFPTIRTFLEHLDKGNAAGKKGVDDEQLIKTMDKGKNRMKQIVKKRGKRT